MDTEEIELKVLGIDRISCEKILRSLDAKKTYDGKILTRFYDFPDNSIKESKNILRLRKTENNSTIIFKKFISNREAKIRKEFEVNISDLEIMNTILESIGLIPILEVYKHRVSYEVEDARFEFKKYLDEHHFIPEFLEIETKDMNTMRKYLHLLVVKDELVKSWSFFEVAEYYKKVSAIHSER
jgi:predicted adenylyl cyclase CyaB